MLTGITMGICLSMTSVLDRSQSQIICSASIRVKEEDIGVLQFNALRAD